MSILFWALFALIIYTYLGYPAGLALVAKIKPRPVKKAPHEPRVSVVISVRDEEDVIRAKMHNLRMLAYPGDKIEFLIGSDGSSDKTVEYIKELSDPRVHLIEFQQRRGKASVLNDLVERASGDIIVFTDARQIFAENAVKELAANFADPAVGCVSGELVFFAESSATARGVNVYWQYEKLLRRYESAIHSMLGATGAIYAVRKNLYAPVPAHTVLDDMYIPFRVIQKGYRAVFDGSAIARDEAAQTPQEEYRRKTRTLFGNYQLFLMMPEMFNPCKSPVAVQFFSHKLLRILMPFFLIALVAVNAALARVPFFSLVMAAQIMFYTSAACGALLRDAKYGILGVLSRLWYVPYVFCLLNFSALAGFFRFISSRQGAAWEKARSRSDKNKIG